MRRRDLLNQSEQRALDLLERALLGHGYRVYPAVPLRKLIAKDDGEDLSLDQERMLKWGELDFLVVNRDGGFGVSFGVEFDGPYHDEPERAKKDRIKDELLLHAGIPLVRVPDSALGEREQITLLEWIVECFLILRTRRPEVEATAEAIVERWADQAGDAIRKGEASPNDPMPFFTTAGAITTMNPFPALAAVRQRLEDRYGIVSFHFAEEPLTGFETVEEMQAAFERRRNADLLLFGPLAPHDEDDEPVGDRVAHPAGGEVIFPETIVVGLMRGGDDHEVRFRHEQHLRRSPQDFTSQIVAGERVGIAMFAADAALAEYQALAEVEKWAARNLARVDRG